LAFTIAAAKLGGIDIIGACTSVSGSVVNRAADAILEALRNYGVINVELANAKKFQLKNNGICSIRLGPG